MVVRRLAVVRTGAVLLGAVTASAFVACAHTSGTASPGNRAVTPPGSLPATAGPALLRSPPPSAPQLTNTGIWKAPPILVSGATAYRSGEFLYQDFLYDDAGANGGSHDPTDARHAAEVVSGSTGTYTYPTGPGYDGDAADLVELRAKPLAGSTAFRITLNTLDNPDLVAFTLALGMPSSTTQPYPFGAGVSGPASIFVTVHGHVAVATAASGSVLPGPSPSVSVDMARHQFEVRVSHALWNPGTAAVTMALGVGLWEAATSGYLVPGARATAETPGGAGSLTHPEAFFNVAFRSGEPADPGNLWREHDQATSLAAGTMAPFTATVDFGKLARGIGDESGVPETGAIDRILASRFAPGAGVDFVHHLCGHVGGNCTGEFLGNLQPYALYVPPAHGGRYGFTYLLHGASANYNEFLGTRNESQFADRGGGSLVATPEARGTDGFYDGLPLADVFEVQADVANHYLLDPAFTDISGYSMGGFGTVKIASQFPDLFARAQPIVGTGGVAMDVLFPSLRNVPVLMWNGGDDPIVIKPLYELDATRMIGDGLRYELDVFAGASHLTFAIDDQYSLAADFLGTAVVDPDPPHVTFVVDPSLDVPGDSIVADHAYWVSALRLRLQSGASGAKGGPPPTGTIDVMSHGFGTGDPTPSGEQTSSGDLSGGNLGTLYYTSRYQTWGPAPPMPVADQIDITATGIGSLTIDPSRAHVDCRAILDVHTDGPLDVTLAGCGAPRHFGA